MITKCEKREEWKEKRGAEFLQSWEWGDFQVASGFPAWRLKIEEGGETYYLQGLEKKLCPGCSYLYFPRCHLSDSVLEGVCDFLNEEDFSFARFEPVSPVRQTRYDIELVENRQPKDTWVIKFAGLSLEDILPKMHSKTRYNLRLAERNGITVKEEKNSEIFWVLMSDTAKKHGFKSYSKEYYEKMLELKMTRQITAYVGDRPLVSNILIFFGDTVTYLHGGSAENEKKLRAPFLLQWEGIKMAMQANAKEYDFWGIAPSEDPTTSSTECYNGFCWQSGHKWGGITRFKCGFPGQIKSYPQAFDAVLKRGRYAGYSLVKNFYGKK